MTPWSSFLKQNLSQIQKYIPKPWKQQSQLSQISASIKTFATQGNLLQAFKSYSILQTCVSSSTLSYSLVVLHSVSSLLCCCNTLKALSQGKQLHGHIITLGFEQNHVLVPKLVTFYTSFGLLKDAHMITVMNCDNGSSFEWNLLISGYVKYGFCREAMFVYKEMIDLGIKPDKFTYPSVVKACCEEFDLSFGLGVHKWIDDDCDLKSDLFVQNALVEMYVKFGDLSVARSLFDEMPVRDVVSWNSMISGYASKGLWDFAFEMFEEMGRMNVEMNSATWNTIAGGCLRTGNYKGAIEMIYQMIKHGVDLDYVTVVIGLSACSQTGFFDVGKQIHGYAVRSCYDKVETVNNALIVMYSRCKDLRRAFLLFHTTKRKSLITWNSMIAGCSHLDQYDEATFIFREMFSIGVRPNNVTVASILPFCARTMNLLHGKEIHCYIVKEKRLKENLLVCNSLVDLYSKSGKIFEAQNVFDGMVKKDKVTYTSLIAGYGTQGKGRTALKLFEEMNMYNIKPDHITMIVVLSACSHSGLVLEGQILFEKMVSLYGIDPQREHFACMAELYAAAGFLRKAVEIIIEMPFQPSRAMLVALISACRIYGNTNIMEWAMNLLEMGTKD
ncbi:hypothetical protein ACHQM5_012827 [Ranunculus cassubicifolius]